MSLLHDAFRNGIAESEVLQTAVSDILEISVIYRTQSTVFLHGYISARTREIRIRIFLRPHLVHEICRNECSIRSRIRTPEKFRLRIRIPIHVSYTLQEDGEVESEPACAKIDTILVSRLGISQFLEVTMIVKGIGTDADLSVTSVRNTVTVRINGRLVYILEVSDPESVFGTR